MISYLKGELSEKEIGRIVVECGGVGYEVSIPISTFDRLPAIGENVKIWTRMIVREDAQLLYGFATDNERKMFDLITTVSGVGPKLALSILSGLNVGDLQLAVSQGDAKRLSSIKGIGKKMAERIVVELRDKINPIEALANATTETSAEQGTVLRDAMLALTTLGFSEEIASAKVKRVLENYPHLTDLNNILTKALNN